MDVSWSHRFLTIAIHVHTQYIYKYMLLFVVFAWSICNGTTVSVIGSGSGYFCDRRSVGQSVLVSSPYLRPMTRFLVLTDICGLLVEGRPLWREDGSVIYLYNLLSLFGPSPAELITTSCCLIWDYILLSHTRLPQPGGNKVAQLYSRTLSFSYRDWDWYQTFL
jgi:hypothetical protein